MAIVYVSPGLATGDNNGTSGANAFRTWANFATAGCAAGSDVRVNANEDSTSAVNFTNNIIGALATPTTITGYSTDWTTPQLRYRNGTGAGANIDGIILNGVSWVFFSYIEIKNYTRDGVRGVTAASALLKWTNCSFHNNAVNGFNATTIGINQSKYINSVFYSNGSVGLVVQVVNPFAGFAHRCKFYLNSFAGISCGSGGGIQTSECLFYSNGIGLYTVANVPELHKNDVFDRNTTGVSIANSSAVIQKQFRDCRFTVQTGQTSIALVAASGIDLYGCAFYTAAGGTRISLGAGANAIETDSTLMASDGYVNGANGNYNLVNGATPAECRWTQAAVGFDGVNYYYRTAGLAPNPDFPAVASVRAPDTVDGVTGTQAALATDADFLTLEDSRNDDPGVATVLSGTAYQIQGAAKLGTLVALAVPAAPTNVQITNVSDNGGLVSWTPGARSASYKVYVDGVLATAGVTVNYLQIGSLAPNTTYSITVLGTNVTGDGAASTAQTFKTLASDGASDVTTVSTDVVTVVAVTGNPKIVGSGTVKIFDVRFIAEALTADAASFYWKDVLENNGKTVIPRG